jgi:hypothetical protein
MAAALIGAAQMDNHLNSVKSSRDSGFFVRLAAGGLIWLFIIAIEPRMEAWLPAPDIVIYGALILIGMGLLHIGMSKLPFGILAGLLTIISGFEILYASIESSVLIAGLMAMINLGLALSGVYLTAQQEERTE